MSRKLRGLVVVATAALTVACGENNGTNNGATNGANNGATNNGSSNNGSSNNGASNNGSAGSNNGSTGAQASVFYYEDVKPIIDANCVDCHTDGGIGPFLLDSYEAVKSVGGLVSVAVSEKIMPPYIYDPECREPTHDPTLTDEEIATITTWVEEGMAEGDPANEGEAHGRPAPPEMDLDTTLELPFAYTPTKSPDDYRCFVMDWPHDTDKFVTGFAVEPGQEKIVHHVVAYIASGNQVQQVEQLDANEDEVGDGYTCYGGPGFQGQNFWLGSWAPGGLGSAAYPEGTGVRVPAGSKIVVQMHYNTLVEDPVPDKTVVKLATADEVDQVAYWLPWMNFLQWFDDGGMLIPAGQSDVEHSFQFDPTGYIADGNPITIHGAAMHMHVLGTTAQAWIERNGVEGPTCLADIPRWDFNWQTAAFFQTPAQLNPGDRLAIRCTWDNSAENQPMVDGRQMTPVDRDWGDGTTDEMCLGLFYITI